MAKRVARMKMETQDASMEVNKKKLKCQYCDKVSDHVVSNFYIRMDASLCLASLQHTLITFIYHVPSITYVKPTAHLL